MTERARETPDLLTREDLPIEDDDPWGRPAPQPGDQRAAALLHERLCRDETCEGWERVGSFGKADWLDAAREVLALATPEPAPKSAETLERESFGGHTHD